MKLLFAGDCFFKNSCDVTIDKKLKTIFDSAQYKCCNFEGAYYSESKTSLPKAGPLLMQAPNALKYLENIGFNIFALANNHIMDYGVENLNITLSELKSRGLLYVGAGTTIEEVYKPLIIEQNELKIGILNIAENGFGACTHETSYGYAWLGNNTVEKQIMTLSKTCDTLIVISHCGAEQFNYPLPQVRELYKKYIDLGADVIIGHHPHVLQGMETYHHKPIFYSLGNFIWVNKQNKTYETMLVEIDINNDKDIQWNIIPIEFSNNSLMYRPNIIEKIYSYSDVLQNEELYINQINEFICDMYENVYKKYYRSLAYSQTDFTAYETIKYILKIILRKNKQFNDIMLYHNICIETHKWICERAINNKFVKKE